MRRLLAGLGVLVACAAVVAGQELLTLASPVYVSAGSTRFRVESLYLKRATGTGGALDTGSPAQIRALFRETDSTGAFLPNGATLTCQYDDPRASQLLSALNTMNFSTTSLEKRVTLQCQTDGKLGAGTVSGAPQ